MNVRAILAYITGTALLCCASLAIIQRYADQDINAGLPTTPQDSAEDLKLPPAGEPAGQHLQLNFI